MYKAFGTSRTLKQILRISGLASLAVVLGACGKSTSPSNSEIEQSIRSRILEDTKGAVSVVSVSKIDGMVQQNGGYIADYKAEVRFEQCGVFGSDYRKTWKVVEASTVLCVTQPGQVLTRPGFVPQFGVGSVVTVPGTAAFVRKESGWTLNTVSLKPPEGQ